MEKKLYRDEYHRVFGGVCAGLAEYFSVDVTIVRLIFVIATFAAGTAVVAYIILWMVLPRKAYTFNSFNNPTVDYRVPPQPPEGDQPPATPPPSGSAYANNPFVNKPYTNNPFENRPFQNRPFSNNPMQDMPPHQRSHAGLIAGVVLIMVGGFILIDNYDLIPDFDFWKLSPLVLVAIGAIMIVSGQAKQAWHKDSNPAAENPDNSTNSNQPATDDPAKEA